jgi:hypothetical protein
MNIIIQRNESTPMWRGAKASTANFFQGAYQLAVVSKLTSVSRLVSQFLSCSYFQSATDIVSRSVGQNSNHHPLSMLVFCVITACGLLCTYNLQVLVVYELLPSGFLQKTWTKPEPNGGETNKVQAYTGSTDRHDKSVGTSPRRRGFTYYINARNNSDNKTFHENRFHTIPLKIHYFQISMLEQWSLKWW